jgi:hypothetical protein
MLVVNGSSDLHWATAWRKVSNGGIVYLDYARQLVVPILLICLYGWLNWLITGQAVAIKGLLDPFRWIKSQSLARFLGIVLTVIAAFYARDVFRGQIPTHLISIIKPDELIKPLDAGSSGSGIWAMNPIFYLPVYLVLQWVVDIYCIHAVQTKGRGAKGVIYTTGVLIKIIQIEARLVWFLVFPYVLYYFTFTFAQSIYGYNAYGWYFYLMQYTFMGFGIVYYPISAIAHSLIIMRQPLVQLSPAEPVDFDDIDKRFMRKLVKKRHADDEGSTAPQDAHTDCKSE